MEKIIAVISLFVIYTLLLLGNISPDRRKSTLVSLLGSGLLALFIAAGFFVPGFREGSVWLWFLGLFAALPVISFLVKRRQAGQLIEKVDEAKWTIKRGSALVVVPFLAFLLLTILPRQSTGIESFLERFPFWFMLVAGIAYFWLFAFSRVELHEKGIVQFDNFMDWEEMLSYSWHEFELDEQLRLRIKVGSLSDSKTGTVTYLVHQTQKKLVDKLLARRLKGKTRSAD